ncbi:MAG: hypothetical protein LBI04_10450 [Treponema sp.]|jgi:hypothetical protein|nr:hypothetical protein [Treponema sp.]
MKKIIYVLLAACIVLGSCSTGEAAAGAAAKLFGGSSKALLFLSCRAVSEDEIEFVFSQPVTVNFLNFEPALAVASIEDGSTVKVRLNEIPKPGMEITAEILAEDTDKNTINVLIPFRARNNRMPRLVINEIRTENTKPKCEFIEFKTLTAGNLGGMRVFIHGNTNAAKQTIYEFLPVEVKKDEYLVLNLRMTEADCKDEYGTNLAESGGTNSSPGARDFWIPENSKLIHKEASAIYVLDQDDRALAAVMISNSAASWWAKDYLAEAAEFLFKQDAWKSADGKPGEPADAVSSANTTNTRTICRDESAENTNTAAGWYITEGSGATPGKSNNPKRYVPK